MKPFKAIVRFVLLASRSPFKSFKDKFEVFRVLCLLSIKKELFPKPKNNVNQKLFGYVVTSYKYGALFCLFKEIFAKGDYCFSSSNTEPKIIDCGANIGMSILFFKKIYPSCHILAFEPNPNAFHLLEKNIKDNKVENVILKKIGLSNKSGSINFYLSENKGSLLGSTNSNRGGNNILKIQTSTLSSYIENKSYDLIKMDVEGAEQEIIDDLVATNQIRNSKTYIIEYHHRINKEASQFSKFLAPFEANGFEYNMKTSYGSLGAFQDVMINFSC
ncbi:FkbM family methyltransferase [Catalinimonas sp. 4WD22]|uniref:FkbM family methyltransferase n=1 Tax=Catalinimonas locisalis TaxID=3133978 RepID=UPI003100B1B8